MTVSDWPIPAMSLRYEEMLPSGARSFLKNCRDSAERAGEVEDHALEFADTLFIGGMSSKSLIVQQDMTAAAATSGMRDLIEFVRSCKATLFHMSLDFGFGMHPDDDEATTETDFQLVIENVHAMAAQSDHYAIMPHFRSDLRHLYVDVLRKSNITKLCPPIMPLYWIKEDYPEPAGLQVGANVEEACVAFFSMTRKRCKEQFPKGRTVNCLQALEYPTTPLFKRALDQSPYWRDQISPEYLQQILHNFTNVRVQFL